MKESRHVTHLPWALNQKELSGDFLDIQGYSEMTTRPVNLLSEIKLNING